MWRGGVKDEDGSTEHSKVQSTYATQIYASPNTCAHPPSPTHLHLSHRHLHHLHTPQHLHHSLTHLYHPFHTPPPSPTHPSTIPYTHLHHPLYTPPLSPTHTSTIPYTHLHHPLHTPSPTPTHTSTIPSIHSTICLPAYRIYRSNNYFRCPKSGPGQRPKTFCAKSDIRFAPNPTYALRQIRHTFCAKSDLVLRQIAHMSNVLVRDLPGHRIRVHGGV